MRLGLDADIDRHGGWIGPGGRELAAWWTAPATHGSSGVLVLPPVGYAYWPTHQTLRRVAEHLAAGGHHVLRVDYAGTGDSAGSQWEGDRVAAWRASAREAARAMRAAGCERLTILGAQLGALLALHEAAGLEADHVVAWAPVTDGRRFLRQLRLLGEPIPPEAPAGRPGDLVSGGVVLNAPTQQALSALGLDPVARRAACAVTCVTLGPDERLAARLQEVVAGDVRCSVVPDGELAFDRPTEEAEIPPQTVRALVAAVHAPEAPRSRTAVDLGVREELRLHHDGAEVVERLVLLGPDGLLGVRSEPAAGAGGPVLLLLNSGSETHVGAGRMWVEYARALAAAGVASIRLDFRGWGESPDDGLAPGRPFDLHAEADVVGAVEDLRAQGEEVVLVGLCAAAWILLEVARRHEVAGVVALNPPLFWSRGKPIVTLSADERVVRREEIAEFRAGRLSGRWDEEDARGLRHPAAEWLEELAATGVPMSLIFSERDDGLEFLEDRIGATMRRLCQAGALHVVEVGGIDHAAHRAWLRPRVVAELLRSFRRVERRLLAGAVG